MKIFKEIVVTVFYFIAIFVFLSPLIVAYQHDNYWYLFLLIVSCYVGEAIIDTAKGFKNI